MTNKAMRLYMLRDERSGAIVTDANGSVVYFTNKMDAKASRQVGQVVSRGPDHKQGPSQTKGAY
jgi:hypothetical protein